MKRQILQRFAFIIVLAGIAGVMSAPASWFGESEFGQKLEDYKITLGLDLAGGTELDYKIDLSEPLAQNADEDPNNNVDINRVAEAVRDALEARVNPAGVGEIVVKRSQINNEEHILIQMPPSANVAKAKRDAEKDNRLEFFAEEPLLTDAIRLKMAAQLAKLKNDPNLWEEKIAELTADPIVNHIVEKPSFQDTIVDVNVAAKLFAAQPGEILDEIIDSRVDPVFTVDDSGSIVIDQNIRPRNILALAKITERFNEQREKEIAAEAEARHILFAYPGARRAAEDVKYQTKEEAQAKAQEVLEQLKNGEADFAELAKEFSTEDGADVSGGNLGKFGKGRMTPKFEEAVFNSGGAKLLDEIVETGFGFHIIEVLSVSEDRTETVTEPKVGYEMIAWDKDDITWEKTELDGAELDAAGVGYDQVGTPVVTLRFSPEGGELFANITGLVAARNCEERPCRLGVKVGGQWITQPTVRQKIIGRDSQIEGDFTFQSARQLADDLNLGAIDAPVTLSGQTSIQAALGEEQLRKSLQAAVFGFLATIIFMILVYRLAGVVAAIALILYAGLFITLLKVWPASFGGPIVLSLAGAAGIALSIGLAVDGNILIFERLKEEIRRGRTMTQALDLGFERAWSAIRDSNLTTLLICIILFLVGSSVIKGFAITLIVGTLLSMFTAVIISRNLLRFFLLFKKLQNPTLFGVKKSEIGKKTAGANIRTRKTPSKK